MVLASMVLPVGANAAPGSVDGLSEGTAASSCWEIKQLTPDAPSGVYWLNTPKLGSAGQFYCDQVTDGGGWVLIGRGREGWSQSNEGQGTATEVRGAITGQAAFTPKQLSTEVIGALLNGQAVKSLPDGVRLRRAANPEGTEWQESTFTFSSPRDEWSWMFANEQRVASWRIGSASGSGGQTVAFGLGRMLDRIETTANANHGWMSGFGYGVDARGSADAASYIWAPNTTTGNPRPFTQVYLRPQLMSSTIYSAIPDTGTAKFEKPGSAESFAMPTVWGVSGLGAGPNPIEGSSEVSAFAEGNGIVYVGGNFMTVQKSAAGASQVAQSYLAAFNVRTGEFVPSFRPIFDKQVKALAVLPDGRLAVGGYFTQVNGQPRAGLVVLNPTTGATDTAFTTTVTNNLTGGIPVVRALDVQDSFLYIGGSFTHMTGGSATSPVYVRAAARVSTTTGTPDRTWNPDFNGSVISLDASPKKDRVYFAGHFTASRGTPALKGAALSATDTSVIPWTIDFSNTTKNYQQAVKEVGEKVWIGGAQHMLYSYDRANMTEASTNIGRAGGDYQTISSDGSVVYAGCHCFDTSYAGARRFPAVGTTWTQATKISSGGAWDNSTGKPVTQFNPLVSQRSGAGGWAMLNDSTGVTWFGGDYSASVRSNWAKQWSGGFVRFAHNDTQAPSSPSGLSATASPGGDVLTWTGSTDNRGSVSYQVLRNDRVVATASSTTVTLPTADAGTKYFVRAADPTGNWSASTPAKTVTAPEPPPAGESDLIKAGSSWSYYFNAVAPSSAWKTTSFDASSWATGAAPLGWGHSQLGTTLTAPDPKPITSYHRKSVTIADASKVASVNLTTRADDGIVVYVNGIEVLRKNIGTGTVSSGTYASTSVTASNAVANPVTVTVPGTAFVTGTNVIAAEVHSNYRTTSSHSFELAAKVTAGSPPPIEEPPVDPPADAAFIATGASWSYSFGATAPASGWQATGFDSSSWSTGTAPLGWGHSQLGTTLTSPDPKPITSYYRKSFTISDATKVASVLLTTRADDGIVVYVNGTEVLRRNIGAGTVTSTTYASTAVSGSTAVANPVTVTVPGSAFVTGTNVIAAEVHSNYRSTTSHSFELSAKGQ
ncbi:MAG TPA: delta-60 repeat domain-containing protein [Glaciibacter sp.]|nr:delta-60 repeat domain-containing protein [Glaciibacter sp.]